MAVLTSTHKICLMAILLFIITFKEDAVITGDRREVIFVGLNCFSFFLLTVNLCLDK